RSFRRQLHQYVDRAPATPLELLALMQHYGAPTRLLDWTYSFYVALFFAVDGSARSDRCAVWALDADWFRDRLNVRHPDLYALIDEDRNLIKRPSSFRDVFRQERPFVCPMSPYYLNDRLIIQQGLFLCPGAVCFPFEDNVAELQHDERGGVYTEAPDANERVIKIEISTSGATRTALLQNLIRMNMSHATLFPGIQGYAHSHEGALVPCTDDV
ncbi:MAG TPA: FRG domain-containing protein, partial [Gemmatimonadaceae bacterium]